MSTDPDFAQDSELLSERVARLDPGKRALLEKLLKGKPGRSGAPPIEPRGRASNVFPLSFAQRRLWFLDQLSPGSPLYNIASTHRLRMAIDAEALGRAFNEIVRRHEILRTTFDAVDGEPMQVIAPALTLPLPVIDLSYLPPVEREPEAFRVAALESARAYDLARGPLLRASLLRLAEQDYLLVLGMHHIVCDGWSMGVLFNELSALYYAYSTGRPSPLPELRLQYADYAVWQRERLQGEVLREQIAYWRAQLAGLEDLQLPADYTRPPVQTFRGAEESLSLPPGLSARLKALSRQEGATLFMTLLAALQVLLYRYTGQEDIAVGSPVAGRDRVEVERLIGFFLNSLVLRSDLSRSPSFRELLRRVRASVLGAYDHAELPFEKLLEELQPQRDLSRTPLFQVFFNYFPGTGEHSSDSEAGPLQNISNFDMTLYASEDGEAIQFRLVYNTDLFAPARMMNMLEQLKLLCSEIVEHPDESVTGYSLLTEAARSILPDPASPLDSSWQGAVHTLFSEWAAKEPHRQAIACASGTCSYRELDEMSDRLARYLVAKGVPSQGVVAIYAHRSAPLVLALMSVLRAGGAFLVLDPAYPPLRLVEYLRAVPPAGWLQLAGAGELPEIVENFVASVPGCIRLVLPRRLDEARDLLQDFPASSTPVEVGPDNLACVGFTSGSTGRPKAVMGRHGPLTHFVPWLRRRFDLGHMDRFSMLSGLSHDPLQRDVFTPLCLGGTVCIPDPDDMGSPAALAEWIARERITIAHLTPAMGQFLTQSADGPSEPPRTVSSMRYTFLVGDVLTRHDVARLRTLAPAATCVNYYGSTETQRAVGHFVIPPEARESWEGQETPHPKEIVPLGRGIEDVQLLVLNEAMQLAGIGEVGQIYVRSPHLAAGYASDETLTRERFITNTFTGKPGDRLYRTGDLGRYMPDGNVEFAGRNDQQVKIRSFRVELGEIEAELGHHEAVQQAVVVVHKQQGRSSGKGAPEDRRLVAYVVAKRGCAPATAELRRFLRERLPAHMIPSAFVLLEAIPITPNGKVDGKALPPPESADLAQGEDPTPPRSAVEKTLVEVWGEVLSMQSIGVHDNFFDMGGHSLLATRLMSRIRRALDVELPLRRLFESPTVAELAMAIEDAKAGHEKRADSPPPIGRVARERYTVRVEDGVVEIPAILKSQSPGGRDYGTKE